MLAIEAAQRRQLYGLLLRENVVDVLSDLELRPAATVRICLPGRR